MSSPILINGHQLDIKEVWQVSHHRKEVAIASEAKAKVLKARKFLTEKIDSGDIIYGVNTGFGANVGKIIENPEDAQALQVNLIRSHAVGLGPNFDEATVRALMLIRLNTLIAGHSGIQWQTVERLLFLLNEGIHPLIPEQGSVGASGDLCPLAHMALALIGEGKVHYQGQIYPTSKVLEKFGLSPIQLRHKEGLALINGTTLMAALGALLVYEAEHLLKSISLNAALAFEALGARKAAFLPEVHEVRRHDGQMEVAEWIRKFTKGGQLLGIQPATLLEAIPAEKLGKVQQLQDQKQISRLLQNQPAQFSEGLQNWDNPQEKALLKFAQLKSIPQDAYSVRCFPQVIGASLATCRFAKAQIAGELNAVVDNPLIFEDLNAIHSAGNFHGQPVALVLDHLKIALAESGNILERIINKTLDPATNDGLPAFLSTNESGLHSGLMIPQYAAAALVSENKVLAHPASVDSIPTSANQEDHVSMGPIGGRQCRTILENVQKINAIGILTAAQAYEIRTNFLKQHRLQIEGGKHTQLLFEHCRKIVPFLEEDRILHDDIANILANFSVFYELADKATQD